MFFPASLDNKQIVEDPNGNEIVNLPVSPFYRNIELTNYRMRIVPSEYAMRPDKVALMELGHVDRTEYIMMFNQIGNPFSIDGDDVLLIPDGPSADAIMLPYSTDRARSNPTDSSIQDILVQNYYKYAGRDSYVDLSGVDDFLNTPIPSGNTDEEDTTSVNIPYMLNDDEESMIIKDGKIYFNNPNDVALSENDVESTDIDKTISDILNGVSTDLSCSNCTYNGTNLSDFIKALNNSNESLTNC